MTTIPSTLVANLRALSTPKTYAAFLRHQGFTTEQIKPMLARAKFNKERAQ